MGRYGSGHNTTDDYVRLDVRWCKRQGHLQPGRSCVVNWSRRGERFASIRIEAANRLITIRYKTRERNGEWQHKQEPVEVLWTACAFGGHRAWFRCPACHRRAAILYGAEEFVCRHCLHLVYESQREAPCDRALRKAQGIHEKLGGTGVTFDPIFKPKGMHWRTYFFHLERMHSVEFSSIPPWFLRLEARQ